MERSPSNAHDMEEEQPWSSSPPRWLKRLLAAPFYAPCQYHEGKKYNLFCVHCSGEDSIFCERCRAKNNKDHNQDHNTIQVYKASGYPAIRMKDIKFADTSPTQNCSIDLSDIQPYRINAFWIYFINKRPQMGNGNVNHIRSNKCLSCKRELQPKSSSYAYTFCSLGCKFVNEESIANIRDRGELGVMKNHTKPLVPARKHRRKGIPRRAPFF
ncbi:hypothetical protein K2173_006246 [Erythroxylum novogranatense]|uniref:PLATZ transcription factor family protein n=1 Tax=Erythroxylum novogranatense TaxID=1862640 RepID=A0AAV8TDM6_9ROSI|nr:hypothetical protein K2173_006246 [Erythroxylum novogranatense]